MWTLQQEALKELAIRQMESKTEKQRESLLEFMKYYREREKKTTLDINWHMELICKKLQDVYEWRTKRLIINVPPRSLKTETVSKAFPVWVLGHKPNTKFMLLSYSAELAEKNNSSARDMYKSDTYLECFPRRTPIKLDQDNRQHRETIEWWQMYATWATWTVTWIWADIILIDDPLKPADALSDVIRTWVNNNFQDTIKSRLNDKKEWAIIIIMQRLHDDDLCWHLLDLQNQGLWEEWEQLVIPAIADHDDEYRKAWESFFEKRFPLEILNKMKVEAPQTFATQYQQQPINKDTQEFHEERFRYYTNDTLPKKIRVFTAVDPAFSKKETADNSCIMTLGFDGMDAYILEYTAWKYNPAELIDKIIYHYNKRNPEKIGIEAFQAQQIIWFNLKAEMERRWQSVLVEDIRQTQDKEAKIRKLIPLYRNGHIYHKIGMEELEMELKRFPRWKHDDIIDALQMCYNLYEVTPNTIRNNYDIEIKYDQFWNPMYIWFGDTDII